MLTKKTKKNLNKFIPFCPLPPPLPPSSKATSLPPPLPHPIPLNHPSLTQKMGNVLFLAVKSFKKKVFPTSSTMQWDKTNIFHFNMSQVCRPE